ncbi:MAG: hypothetical protein IJT91_06320 [Clostridia bacterium]|nr:hypothetical protein [Clostridia bacterium]
MTSISRRIISDMSLVALPMTERVSGVLKSVILLKSSILYIFVVSIPHRKRTAYATLFVSR